MSEVLNAEELRNEWLDRLSYLVQNVKNWAEKLGWSTRQIELAKEDSKIGRYQAPALLLQKDATRILLEPIARSAPGASGVVDLYLMPAYDDIASLYLVDDHWQLHYMFSGTPTVETIREAEGRSLTEETLREVLDEMSKSAV